MSQSKRISIQQKNYSIFAILKSQKFDNYVMSVPISLPEETFKPQRQKITNTTYISPKQAIKLNLKAKLSHNVRQFQRKNALLNRDMLTRLENNFNLASRLIKPISKKQLMPQQKEKKRNIRQYLHQIAKKSKKLPSKIESESYLNNKVQKNNKFKTVLIVKNMSIDQKPQRTSSHLYQDQPLINRNNFPIHQTYSYFFNRRKQDLDINERAKNLQRNKTTIQQLCLLRQELKKCSQSEQTFHKYRRRSVEQQELQYYAKEETNDTINQIYNTIYRKSFGTRKIKKSSFSVNKQWTKSIKDEQISPWNKKVIEDNQLI